VKQNDVSFGATVERFKELLAQDQCSEKSKLERLRGLQNRLLPQTYLHQWKQSATKEPLMS
jgi:hypothetical protein